MFESPALKRWGFFYAVSGQSVGFLEVSVNYSEENDRVLKHCHSFLVYLNIKSKQIWKKA